MGRMGGWLRDDVHEDFLCELFAFAVKLAAKYDPTKGLAFSTYLWRLGSLHVITLLRKHLGDSRYGPPRPEPLCFDSAPPTAAVEDLDVDGWQLPAPEPTIGDPMELLERALAGDPSTDCDPALMRLLQDRPGTLDRDLRLLRAAAPRPAGRRTHGQAA